MRHVKARLVHIGHHLFYCVKPTDLHYSNCTLAIQPGCPVFHHCINTDTLQTSKRHPERLEITFTCNVRKVTICESNFLQQPLNVPTMRDLCEEMGHKQRASHL